MIRTIPVIDKSVVVKQVKPLVVAAATATKILGDITTMSGEYAVRIIQNVGANPIYLLFGSNAVSPQMYNVILGADSTGSGAGSQLECTAQEVWGWSVSGTTIAYMELIRKDNAGAPWVQALQPPI